MATSEPRYERIGVKNLTIDDSIQCRMKTDLDWASELSAFFLSGSDCPPIDVFEVPDGRLFVASGFQRYAGWCKALEAKPDLGDIPCRIFKGTVDEAIVFSCGSNRGNGKKPMGPKDLRKAILMLLKIDETRNWGDSKMASHVGCSKSLVGRVRIEANTKEGIPIPEIVLKADGKTQPRSTGQYSPVLSRDSNGRLRLRDGGRKLSFSAKQSDEARLTQQQVERRRKDISRICKNWSSIVNFFTSNRILLRIPPGKGPMASRFRARCAGQVVFSWCDIRGGGDIRRSICDVLGAWLYLGRTGKMAVVLDTDAASRHIMDLFRREMGIEFLTPEELVERLKADESQDGPSSAAV